MYRTKCPRPLTIGTTQLCTQAVDRDTDINLFVLRGAALSPTGPLSHPSQGMFIGLDTIRPSRHCPQASRPEVPFPPPSVPGVCTGAHVYCVCVWW